MQAFIQSNKKVPESFRAFLDHLEGSGEFSNHEKIIFSDISYTLQHFLFISATDATSPSCYLLGKQ